MNKVSIMGRLTRDVEINRTAAGKSVGKFSVAVNRTGKDKEADFIEVVVWEKTAETISKYFKKGEAIIVHGELRVDNYTDKEGNKRNRVYVSAREFNFVLSSPRKQEENNQSAVANVVPSDFTTINDDDDLPF